MDLQKMAEEFAAAVMGVLRDASLEELIGTEAPIPYRVTARPWADVRWPKETPAALKLSTFKPIAKKVKAKVKKPATVTEVVALGTTLKMRTLAKDVKKAASKAPKKSSLKAKKMPLRKASKPIKESAASKVWRAKKAIKRSMGPLQQRTIKRSHKKKASK